MQDGQFGENPMMAEMEPIGAEPVTPGAPMGGGPVMATGVPMEESVMSAGAPAEEPMVATDFTSATATKMETAASVMGDSFATESQMSAQGPVASASESTSEPIVTSTPAQDPTVAMSTPAPVSESATPVVASTQSAMVGANGPKKKSNVVLIIILVVLALAMVVATGFIAYNMGKNDGLKSHKSNNSSSYVGDEKDGVEEGGEKEDGKREDGDDSDDGDEGGGAEEKAAAAMKKRNDQREDDLARVVTAIGQYQANNNGKIPFRDGATTKDIAIFVRRYIEQTCMGDDAMALSCSGDGFRDPQGDVYKMKNMGEATTGNISAKIAAEKTFYGFYSAECGSKSGYLKKTSGTRDAAVFIKLEGGSIVCIDNH